MQMSESIANLAAALVKAQPQLKHPKKNARNPHLRNKFADLGSVIDANRDLLASCGLAVVQTVDTYDLAESCTTLQTATRHSSKGSYEESVALPYPEVGITTTLVHESGEYISDTHRAPVEPMKGLNMPQCEGVTITYLRRYGWQTILGLNAEDDTDGAAGGPDASAPRDTEDLL